MDTREIIRHLWNQYLTENPQAQAIHGMLTVGGETVVHDHVAFRTFDVGPFNAKQIARIFLDRGYARGGDYDIKAKKVSAFHLDPPRPGLPKVFVSELRTGEFSPELQRHATWSATLGNVNHAIRRHAGMTPDVLWSGTELLASISYETYLRFREESEYAAWFAAFGYRANHFTVSVNDLSFTQDIREVNRWVANLGIPLNQTGGEVKGSPEQLLEQSSTMAPEVPVRFNMETHRIPGCYYEFAKRYPQADGTLFPGFIETSATNIFDSTTATR